MAAARVSRLQQRILCWLAADHRRSQGVIASSQQELVRALQGDKGHISHRLRTLEARNLLVIGRASGGQAEELRLTPEGQQGAMQLAGRCDAGSGSVETERCRAHHGPSPVPTLACVQGAFEKKPQNCEKGAECVW